MISYDALISQGQFVHGQQATRTGDLVATALAATNG